MGWFKKKPKAETPPGEEHAVLLHIRLGDDAFGLPGETDQCHALQDELRAAIEESATGMVDGDEFGDGKCVIYMYGPNADALWDSIAPVLEKKPFRKSSYAIKRYGGPDCTKQERINLHRDG